MSMKWRLRFWRQWWQNKKDNDDKDNNNNSMTITMATATKTTTKTTTTTTMTTTTMTTTTTTTTNLHEWWIEMNLYSNAVRTSPPIIVLSARQAILSPASPLLLESGTQLQKFELLTLVHAYFVNVGARVCYPCVHVCAYNKLYFYTKCNHTHTHAHAHAHTHTYLLFCYCWMANNLTPDQMATIARRWRQRMVEKPHRMTMTFKADQE